MDMNERIRAGSRRPQVPPASSPEPEPEREQQPVDYGAGPRPLASGSDSNGMNRWLRARYARHRQQPETVQARPPTP
jgi:hypothetical protein